MARKIVSIRLSEARALHLDWYDKRGKVVRSSKYALEALERVIGNKLVRNIDSRDIDQYFSNRVQEGLAQSTLNLHTDRLNQFFKWAERHSYIDPTVMPMDDRGRVKEIPKQRARVGQEDFAALLDAAANPRDRIVLAIGLYLFLRASEIRGLRVGDLQLDAPEPTAFVTRIKTRQVANLPVCRELYDELANYLMWYSSFTGQALEPEWYLAPSNNYVRAKYNPATRLLESVPLTDLTLTPGKQMWENGYAKVVQRALRRIGWTVQPGEGCHTLRRSGARELFDQLRDEKNFDDALLTVMAMLGHARPETTMIYLGIDREEQRARRVLAGKVMFPRAAAQRAREQGGNVVALRAGVE